MMQKGLILVVKRQISKFFFFIKNITNQYIIYNLDVLSKDLNTDFVLGNSLFEAVNLIKIAPLDIASNKYNGCDI